MARVILTRNEKNRSLEQHKALTRCIEGTIQREHDCCCSPDHDNSCQGNIPLEIIVDHVTPFLDRTTYNSFLLLSRRAHSILTTPRWQSDPLLSQQEQQQQFPPWPRKVVARDHSCRVRCLTFSDDHSLLACGCFDGKIRSWDVRTGELPLPYEGHWPDEAVVAVAYSSSNRNLTKWNDRKANNRRMLASSSTDGTIRIWRVQPNPETRRAGTCGDSWSKAETYSKTAERVQPLANGTASVFASTKRQRTATVGDEGNECEGVTKNSPTCLICIAADHAYSLHFSPDNSYLVSGHLPVSRTQATLQLGETIQIWDVWTGIRLRRLEGGGVPVAFLPSQTLPRDPSQLNSQKSYDYCATNDDQNENKNGTSSASRTEHRLISSCGPSKCFKLWSWSDGTRCDNTSNIAATEGDTVLENDRCVQRWFLDPFNTVVPVPTGAMATGGGNDRSTSCTEKVRCELLVASIDGPDSFAIWNTSEPGKRRTFRNTSPYEIQFSPDGRKVASVDDFNKVKVWRVSDGTLLQSFSGETYCEASDGGYGGSSGCSRCCRRPCGRCSSSSNIVTKENDGFEESSPTSSSGGGSGGGLFPIHELAFSKNSSTVAVISRYYNEVHLFSA